MRRVSAGFRIQDSRISKGAMRVAGDPPPATGHESRFSDTRWRVGQSVIHPSFGAGVIVGTEGRGADARVQVNFRAGGLKWLVLEYAKLAPA